MQITPWRPQQKEEPHGGKKRGQGRGVYPKDRTRGQAEGAGSQGHAVVTDSGPWLPLLHIKAWSSE